MDTCVGPDDDQVDDGVSRALLLPCSWGVCVGLSVLLSIQVPGRFVLDDMFFGNGTATSYYAPPPPPRGQAAMDAQAAGDLDEDTRDDYDEVDDPGFRPREMVPPSKFREYNMDYRW